MYPTTSLRAQNWFSTTLSSSISASDTTIPLNSVPTNTEGYLVIEPDSTTNREIIYFNSKTASAVVCPDVANGRGQDGTSAVSHSSGVTVKMTIVNAYWDALRNLFTTTPQGWTALTGTFTSPTYNGNRSYSIPTSVDQSAIVSPGMRLRVARTVAAPTQCTSLNGSTQYYSKSSPAGMTFTDDFVVGAWVKLTSYTQGIILGRYNGTSGWYLQVNSSGQVILNGGNGGGGNNSQILTYQSLPLNKWVHVTAQLDMLAFTTSSTTSYIMVDGVNVPCSLFRNGTNPTALVQAGNLEVGSMNGGTQPFPGKIAQAFVTSAKLTQTQVRAIYSQGLTSSDMATYSIVSAYSFNNSINDINTTNANNLTANGSAVATNADSPFTQNAAGTPGGTYDYAIVTAISSSTITCQVPEGCTIPTSGGISAAAYSSNKVPFGFPASSDKWSVSCLIRSASTAQSSPVSGTYYNFGGHQLSVPVGAWRLSYSVMVQVFKSAAATFQTGNATLSTVNNAVSDSDLTGRGSFSDSSNGEVDAVITKSKKLQYVAATPLYLNVSTDSSSVTTIKTQGGVDTTSIEAEFIHL